MKTNSHKCQTCPSKGEGIFCDLENQALDKVSSAKVFNTYKKGQTLFMEGSPPYGLFCIQEGTIKLTKTGEDGKESIVRIACNGDVLGHRSIFSDTNFQATATAIEETTVCFIDRKFIMRMVSEEPTVAQNIICQLGKSLGDSEDRIASFAQKNVRERTAELLLILNESHGKDHALGRLLEIKLTREEMASIISTATETLIRQLSEFKEEGVIKQEGKKLIIANIDQLAGIAGR